MIVIAKQGGTVLAALEKELPLLSRSALREALKKRDVRLNGVRIDGNAKVNAGDELMLFTTANDADIPVLFEDSDCVIVNKPAGLNSDENARSGMSLIVWAREKAGCGDSPVLVHRLDNQTSGLMVIAKNPTAGEALLAMFKHGTVHKQYTALVLGQPQPPRAKMTAWLTKDARLAKVTVTGSKRPDSKQIITEYDTVVPGAVSRVLLTLHTGRTHQIRAHLAFLGFPVLGDDLYGNREANRTHRAGNLKLCASALGFPDDCPLEGLEGKHFEITPPF